MSDQSFGVGFKKENYILFENKVYRIVDIISFGAFAQLNAAQTTFIKSSTVEFKSTQGFDFFLKRLKLWSISMAGGAEKWAAVILGREVDSDNWTRIFPKKYGTSSGEGILVPNSYSSSNGSNAMSVNDVDISEFPYKFPKADVHFYYINYQNSILYLMWDMDMYVTEIVSDQQQIEVRNRIFGKPF